MKRLSKKILKKDLKNIKHSVGKSAKGLQKKAAISIRKLGVHALKSLSKKI